MDIAIKKKLIQGSAWAFVGRGTLAFSGLVISSMLVRLITPAEVGAYFLTMSIITISSLVAQLGLTQTVVRLVAEAIANKDFSKAKLSILIIFRVLSISTIIIALILFFGIGNWVSKVLFNSSMISMVMGWAAILVVVSSFQQVISEIFRGFHDIRLATLFGGLLTSVLTMLLFASIWVIDGHGNFEQVMVLSLGAGIVSTLFSSFLLWKKLDQISSSENGINLSGVLSISWPLWLTNITLFVLGQADLWIVGMFLSSHDVAIYGTATRLVALVAMPLLIVNAVVQPVIAEMYSQGKIEILERILRTITTIACLCSFLAFIMVFFMGEELLAIIFGDYYKAGSIVLIILAIGQLANVYTGPCGYLLMLTGHQICMMKISITSSLLTVLLGYLMVVEYGSVGVAIAAAFGMALQNFLMLMFAKKKVGVWSHARLTSFN